MMLNRWGLFAGVPLLGALIGIAVAVASSLPSLTPDRHGETAGFVQPSPTPPPSPLPSVKTPGILGNSARLLTNGSNAVVALSPNQDIGSSDGGRTWFTVVTPANGLGLAVDPANARHAVTGGTQVQVTNDGVAWNPTLHHPPGTGPYQPLAISPVEPDVWLFLHQTKLLVTRDGGATWFETNLPSLSSPMVVPGQALGQFYLVGGNRVFLLTSYGQTITELTPLSQGSVSELAVVGGNHPGLIARVAGQGVFVDVGGTWSSSGSPLSGPVAAGGSGAMLVGNGGGKLGVAGSIVYSTNGGQTWLPAHGLPSDQTVEAIAGQAGSTTFFAYCYGGDLYESGDDGASWTLVSHAFRAAG